jgi:hypothetical protein
MGGIPRVLVEVLQQQFKISDFFQLRKLQFVQQN